MPRPEYKFNDLKPYRAVRRDTVRVNVSGIALSTEAYKRMGYPETLRVQISEGGAAIQLSVPGPFTVRAAKNAGKTTRYSINSVVVGRAIEPGLFAHAGENLFIRE